jgi:peroxisomal membrane protein 4
MIMLFRSGTIQEKIRLVIKATRTHAQNLAKFATVYKLAMIALKRGVNGGKEGPYDTFFSGLLGGYLVFGRRHPKTGKVNSVAQQIVIYVFARVVLAIAKLSVEPQAGFVQNPVLSHRIKDNAWPVFAAMSWGMVMFVFRWHPESIQPSLRSSMSYIYVQSDTWDSLRTLLWHNK